MCTVLCVFVQRVWLSKIWTGALVPLCADPVELRWDTASKREEEEEEEGRREEEAITKSSKTDTAFISLTY